MIPIYKPSIKRKEMDALLSTLVSDYLDSKNDNSEFLKAISKFLHLEGGALLRDYSTAISVALDSLELGSGSRVLISPLSPSSYLRELEKRGITVVYADVDIISGCICHEEMERLLDSDIDAFILYSPNGISPDYSFLADTDIPVIEDITTTVGCSPDDDERDWTADIIILKMELPDIITSGEGTAILAGDKKNLSSLRNNLSDLPVTAYLLNMHAAMGLIQLDSIEHFLERRREIGKIYEASILKGHHKAFYSSEEQIRNYPAFHVVLNTPLKEVSRYARKNGVMVELAFSDSSLAMEPSDSKKCPNARSLL
ncbi:MAG: DegT/DnrJ/EryC1/StrS aminotransferase family protein, partial [Spirochaetales bacterium]|nr:DegT/DnrJ/EryC1/StrS aminotransferase family protein [Spirochaetales bacterium]